MKTVQEIGIKSPRKPYRKSVLNHDETRAESGH